MNRASHFCLSMFFVLIYYLVLDGTMIFTYTSKVFGEMISKIQNGKKMETRAFPGILCFFVLAFGITYYVLPRVDYDNIPRDSARYGLIWGLVVYAVYDLTNLATFGKYEWKVALFDIIWGGILGFIVTLITAYTMRSIKRRESQRGGHYSGSVGKILLVMNNLSF